MRSRVDGAHVQRNGLYLRVATLNVWGLPWGFARHVQARMRAIGNALSDLDADVVALQEVWAENTRGILLDAAARAGLAHTWHNRAAFGGSGLLVLSRLPIVEARFDPYVLRGFAERVWHADYWGGKGFAILGLQTPGGPVALVVTHLHSQYAPDARDDYRAHRMGQVVQLAAALHGIRVPLVAAGDFNLRDDQPTYRVLTGLARLRDAAAERGRREPTSIASNPYRARRVESDARIDYVFVRDGLQRAVRTLSVQRIFDEPLDLEGEGGAFSDHAGLLAELEIAAAQTGPPLEPDAKAVGLARDILEAGRRTAALRRRRRRSAGAGAASVGVVTLAAARRARLARRGVLRGLLASSGLIALSAALGWAALAELFAPRELRAFDTILRRLDELASGAAH